MLTLGLAYKNTSPLHISMVVMILYIHCIWIKNLLELNINGRVFSSLYPANAGIIISIINSS